MTKMVIKLFYSEISGSKEVKKRQQRIMMILDSKSIPYEAIDITEAGKETAKDFMLTNAKPRGDSKVILSPQIFSDDLYCGDYDDFDLANENDVLEKFLNSPKIEKNTPVVAANGNRESSTEAEPKPGNANGDRNDNENSSPVVTSEQSDPSNDPEVVASAADEQEEDAPAEENDE